MPITSPLQRFIADELAGAASLAGRMLTATVQQLRSSSGGNPRDNAARLELADALQRHSAAFHRTFTESLQQQVSATLAAPAGSPGGAAGAWSALELMDESRVEVDIEISRATQRIDSAAEWELRELQTFTSTLIGQAHVSAESNPLRPLAYATALWQATGAVTPLQAHRALLLRQATDVLAGLLKHAWAAACTRLESQGVEPGVYRTLRLPPGTVPTRAQTVDVTRPGALQSLLSSMPPAAAAPDAPATPLAAQRGDEREAVRGSAPAGVEPQIVQLLSQLFETLLSDAQLPPGLRPALARLQEPALRAALSDATVLATHEHPVWQLLDRIGEAAAAWVQADDPRLLALQALCQRLADDVAGAAQAGAAPFRQALGRLEEFLAAQLQHQTDAAQVAIQALRRAEHREFLQRTIAGELAQRLARAHTSPVLQRFVTETWAKVIAESMLRHGEDAEPTAHYLKASDDLLWSLQTPDHPQSRQRLLTLLPGLLQRLREGMALVDVHEAEQQRVLDELMLVHTEALRPGGRSGAAASEPSEIVRRLRDELERDSLLPAPFSDSVIDLASMETVPAELLQSSSAAAGAADPGKPLDGLRPGARRRLFVRGRWSRSQLLWRSDRGQFFLFADEVPGLTHSITRRALERLHEAGLVQPLEPRPLVQRAVDGLLRRLARPGG